MKSDLFFLLNFNKLLWRFLIFYCSEFLLGLLAELQITLSWYRVSSYCLNKLCLAVFKLYRLILKVDNVLLVEISDVKLVSEHFQFSSFLGLSRMACLLLDLIRLLCNNLLIKSLVNIKTHELLKFVFLNILPIPPIFVSYKSDQRNRYLPSLLLDFFLLYLFLFFFKSLSGYRICASAETIYYNFIKLF